MEKKKIEHNAVWFSECLRGNECMTIKDMGDNETVMFTKAGAKVLADAIYAELGLGWLPYPENKPEKSGLYSVTISPNSCVPLPRVVRRDFYNCDTDKWRDFESADIVAFMKDVQPYSKRKQRQP